MLMISVVEIFIYIKGFEKNNELLNYFRHDFNKHNIILLKINCLN